jgi:hypothetical protein
MSSICSICVFILDAATMCPEGTYRGSLSVVRVIVVRTEIVVVRAEG